MTDIGAAAPAIDPTAGMPDAPPPADPIASIAWEKAQAQVILLNTPEQMIATMWHPDAVGDVVVTPHGSVRVVKGDTAQYQLTTGDIVPL